MKIRAAVLLSLLPLVSFAACSIYDSSLVGSGGSTATSGPTTGSEGTSTSMTSSTGMGGAMSTGTGGAMSTGTGGAMSTGTGGAMPCTTASECPGVDTPCQTRTCIGGTCGVDFAGTDHLVLSEIRSRGVGGAADEFIEIYNPTSADVVLDSTWKIEARGSNSTSYAARWTGTGKTIGSHRHFLLTNTGYAQTPAKDEATTTTGITDATSVRLVHATKLVDAVCYGFDAASKGAFLVTNAGYDCEGATADNLPHNNLGGAGDADVSIQRRPGGALGNCIDTGDNAADFITTTPAAPQNATSAATP